MPERIRLPERHLAAENYNLAATLDSGQTFRWQSRGDAWIGIVGDHWIRAAPSPGGIRVATSHPRPDWKAVRHYFRTEEDIDAVTGRFPGDGPMKRILTACHGLRLMRQDPWECLASFLLSSTKRIPHIARIVERLCNELGDEIVTPADQATRRSFPSPDRIAALSPRELHSFGMGYRAPWLHNAARTVAEGELELEGLHRLPYAPARELLTGLPGVGPKIADCILLFAYGRQQAFPIDVWVGRALEHFYFRGRHQPLSRLGDFAREHFAPHAGYAQQYLFHYMRTGRAGSNVMDRKGMDRIARK